MTTKSPFSRRNFLEILGLTGAGVMLRSSALNQAFAQTAGDPNFLVMVYFNGGWDQLVGLDPRDQRAAQHRFNGATRPTSGIYPAYAEYALEDANVRRVMNTATGTLGVGSGVQTPPGAAALSFGPAVASSLLEHSRDLAIVRGVSMDTLTHEVGRRFFTTGKFPRGLAASGSSLNTVVTAQSPAFAGTLDVPNLVLLTETYNETYPAFASGVEVRNSSDVQVVLSRQAQSPQLAAASEAALANYERIADSCEGHGYDVGGLTASFRESQAQARRMVTGTLSSAFNFGRPTDADTIALLRSFGIRETGTPAAPVFNTTDLSTGMGRAALAAQAITQGLSQAVSVNLASGLDDHFDIYGQQGLTQHGGWDALGRLLAYLKTKTIRPGGPSYYERTTLMVFSEFSRTPMVNQRDGRDHHLTNSCLLKGPGIKGNTVFGASTEVGQQFQKFNPTTGAVDPSAAGKVIKPADVHATLLQSMGLSYAHLNNQSPRVLTPLLKTPT